jgi:hypothetical protein
MSNEEVVGRIAALEVIAIVGGKQIAYATSF